MHGVGFVSVVLIIVVVGGSLAVAVHAAVLRSSATGSGAGSHDGVLFVVRPRRGQRILLRTVGIVMVVVSGFALLVAATSPSDSGGVGSTIAGGAIGLVGVYLIWGAHYWAYKRLEVAPDTVWVYRLSRRPRRVLLSDITRLRPIPSNNFGSGGGFVARAGRKRLFAAPRTMIGYTELIDHLHSTRPDLRIPADAHP